MNIENIAIQSGRSGHPSRALLEECVRGLEGGAAAAAFGSGMAAIMSVHRPLPTNRAMGQGAGLPPRLVQSPR